MKKNTGKEKAVRIEGQDGNAAGSRGRKAPAVLGGIVILAGIMIFVVFYVILPQVESFGKGVGQAAGTFAGTVKGSFEGITQGLASGYEAGTEQGLSAEDTNVAVNDITTMGRLDVLVAEDQIVDKYEEGDSYKALFVYKAKVTFSVDLGQAEIISEDSVLRVLLPEPEVDVVIDEKGSEKIAEWQKFFWSGNTEAGYIGYMNSMSKIKEKAEEEMKSSDYLIQQAKDSAVQQVGVLVRSASVEEKQVEIEFKGDGQ